MDAIDYNFARSIATFAASSKTGEACETRDLLLTSSGAAIAAFNQGVFKRPDYKFERAIARTFAFRDRVRLPLRMHLSSEHATARERLLAQGFTPAEAMPAMVLPSIGELPFSVAGLTIQRVQDTATLEHFARTAFESFGYPADLSLITFTEDLLALPHVELFVGYLDREPACCSMVLATGEVAGIYWVGALERFRRRGLGAAITAHAVRAGLAHGCRIGSLQASAMGAPVYRRMGFSVVREYLRFELALG